MKILQRLYDIMIPSLWVNASFAAKVKSIRFQYFSWKVLTAIYVIGNISVLYRFHTSQYAFLFLFMSIAFFLFAAVCSKMLQSIIVQVEKSEREIVSLKQYKAENEVLKRNDEEVSRDIFVLLHTCAEFEGGKLYVRSTISPESELFQLSSILNNILSRHSKLLLSVSESIKTRKAAEALSQRIIHSISADSPIDFLPTGTCVDDISSTLKHSKIVKYK